MALSPLGKVYVAGETRSGNFPTILQSYDQTPGQKWDGFVARFNPDLTTLETCPLLGYSDNDCIYAILLDTDASVVVAGETYSFRISRRQAEPFAGSGGANTTLLSCG